MGNNCSHDASNFTKFYNLSEKELSDYHALNEELQTYIWKKIEKMENEKTKAINKVLSAEIKEKKKTQDKLDRERRKRELQQQQKRHAAEQAAESASSSSQ